MKKVFYLSPIAILVSVNVFSAPLHNYAEINTTNTAGPSIAQTATHSIAIGPEASVDKNDAYASASSNRLKGMYSGQFSIAEGYKATVKGSQSIAYGHEAVANGWLSYAIGSRANAEGDGNIALGGNAKSLAGAYYGNPSSGGAIAVGQESSTIGNGAIAMGNKAQASGVKSIAIGNDARTLDITNTDGAANIDPNVKNSIKTTAETLRKQNSPLGMTADLIGLSDEATSTIAIGDESRAIGWGSTALGTKAYALNDRATTLGDDSKTLGYAGTAGVHILIPLVKPHQH